MMEREQKRVALRAQEDAEVHIVMPQPPDTDDV